MSVVFMSIFGENRHCFPLCFRLLFFSSIAHRVTSHTRSQTRSNLSNSHYVTLSKLERLSVQIHVQSRRRVHFRSPEVVVVAVEVVAFAVEVLVEEVEVVVERVDSAAAEIAFPVHSVGIVEDGQSF